MLYVMLVGAYPFERPEDKHDNKKLQKMIQVRHMCLGHASVHTSLHLQSMGPLFVHLFVKSWSWLGPTDLRTGINLPATMCAPPIRN